MNVNILNEVVRKFHLGEFHSEDTKPEDRKILKGKTLKYAPYLCFCDIQDNEVEVLYDYDLKIGNAKRINDKIRELEVQGKIFEAFVQLAYLTQIEAKEATNYRASRNLEVFSTDYDNYVAHVQVMIDFGQELKRSKESFDRLPFVLGEMINRAREKEKLEEENKEE